MRTRRVLGVWAVLAGLMGHYVFWDGAFWPVILVCVGSAPFVWLRRPGIPTARVAR